MIDNVTYPYGYCSVCLNLESECSCPLLIDNRTHPTSLTPMQKLHAMAYKYYSGIKWEPKKGDYYTTSRADLELYQVVDVTETKVMTKYLVGSDTISEWDKDRFTTEGFGVNRVHVPVFCFKF